MPVGLRDGRAALVARCCTCARCGDTFPSAWTEEEALAEMRSNFGDVPEDQRVVVCDDCYQFMTSIIPLPGQAAQS